MEELKMVSLDEKTMVFKSNPIIEGRFPKGLTSREMDLLTVLFTTIDTKSDNIAVVRINIRDLIKLYGLEASKSAYQRIYEVSENLLSRVIKVTNEKTGEHIQYNLLSKAHYYSGQGFADFKFNDELKPYLVELKQYAKYVLRHFLALDSFYAKRIYELIIQYRNMKDKGGKWSRQISIDDIRNFLGIDKKEYYKYSHLKIRVIELSVSQINERTDIKIEYEEVKLGRRVDSIIFTAIEKATPPESFELTPPDPTTGKDYARLVAYGVGEATAKRLVTDHPADVVAFNLDQLDAILRSKRGERVGNPAGWLVAGIEANRGEQLNLLAGPAKKQDEAKRREQRKAELSEALMSVKTPYNEYRKKMVGAYISTLTDEENAEKKADFEDYIKAKGNTKTGPLSFALSQLNKKGLLDTVVLPYFVDYLNEKGELSILSISAFAEKRGVKEYDKLRAELERIESEHLR